MGHTGSTSSPPSRNITLLPGRKARTLPAIPGWCYFVVAQHAAPCASTDSFFQLDGPPCWDLCTNALDTAKLRGAAYGDVRVMHLRQRDLTTKTAVGTLSQSESDRPRHSRAGEWCWGFASTDRLTREGRRGLRARLFPSRRHRHWRSAAKCSCP